MKDLIETLNDLKNQLGINQIQIGPLATPLTISFYEKWLAEGLHADMGYLQDHLQTKKNPQLLNSQLKSVLTISQSYFPPIVPMAETIPARIATYAQNKDYHFWLKEKLLRIISELKQMYPNEEFLPYVDSGPVLERNWAYENGLGWFGKNTCLIHPQHGSLFFIAEIFSTLPPPAKAWEPLPDFCGTCTRCIDICPTQALVKPHILKADLCISYLTIESKTLPPVELRKKMGDWFFGCDLCQTTCPWNEKVFRKLEQKPAVAATSTALTLNLSAAETEKLILFFKNILNSSNKKLEKEFYGTALFRAGGNGLKRNAMIVIGNRKLTELGPDVDALREHPKLGELAIWCKSQLIS